jgi:hypothetical protein
MELTPFQRRTLEDWRRMKPAGLTWTLGLRRLARSWSMLAVAGVGVYLLFPLMWPPVAGLIAGTCLRDLGYINSARSVWPLSLEVIDWAKVDKLLDQR